MITSSFFVVLYKRLAIFISAGADYTTVITEVTFQPNEATKTVTVPIIDDNIFENVETFTATLTTSDEHVSIGADSMATVFITDNDSKINLLHTYTMCA